MELYLDQVELFLGNDSKVNIISMEKSNLGKQTKILFNPLCNHNIQYLMYVNIDHRTKRAILQAERYYSYLDFRIDVLFIFCRYLI